MIAHLWLLTSALRRVRAGAWTRPAGIWEEQSRIYTHKSDRCMACHYLPLIIILPLLFILWATSAVFFWPGSETFALWPCGVIDAPVEAPGYCCHSYSSVFSFVCAARVWAFNPSCLGVCVGSRVSVLFSTWIFLSFGKISHILYHHAQVSLLDRIFPYMTAWILQLGYESKLHIIWACQ